MRVLPRTPSAPIDDTPVPPPDERVAIGRINSPWGLKGHVKVTPLTANPERITVGAVVILNGVRARIEDIVLCGDAGPVVLNVAPRDLLIVPG